MRRRRGNSSTPLRLVLSCLRRKRREEGEEEETIGASNVSSWEIDLSHRTEQDTSEQLSSLCLIAASWSSSHRNTIGWEDPTCIEKSAAIARTFFVSLRKMAMSSTCGQLLHHLRGCDELRDDDEGILHHSRVLEGSYPASDL
jgi:hypothetical protein